MNDMLPTVILPAVASNAVLAAVLALVVLAITRLWRNPHLAHALWLLVLIKLVTPPLWRVPWPEEWSSPPLVEASDVGLVQAGQPGASNAAVTGPVEPLPAGDWQLDEESAQLSGADQGTEFVPLETAGSPPPRAAARAPALAPRGTTNTWLPANWPWIVAATWGIGVAAFVVWVVRAQRRFRAVLGGSEAACDEWVQDAARFSQAMGLRRCPILRVTEAQVPPLVATAGRTPVMLLPRQLLMALDREQRQTVLVHELAHLRRRDHWVRWLEVTVLCIFWWNPVAWWAAGMLRAAAEECCDAWVLWLLPRGRRSYGRALLRTVEFLTERDVVPAVAGAALGGFPIKRRIEMIMRRELPRKMSWPVGALLLLLAAVVLPLAAPAVVARGQSPSEGDPGPAPSAARGENRPPRAELPSVAVPAPGARAEGAQDPPSSRGGTTDRKLEDRIERLERVVDDLVQALKAKELPPGPKVVGDSLYMVEARRAQAGANPLGGASDPAPGSSNASRSGTGSAARPDRRLAKTAGDGKLIVLVTPGAPTSEIVSFDSATGRILWKSLLSGRAEGFAKADDPAKRLAVRCGGKVHELDLGTGKVLSRKDDAGAAGAKAEPLLKIYHLKFTTASAMAEHIRKIYPTLTISADERTNSIVAQGNEVSLEKLEALVKALDRAEEK